MDQFSRANCFFTILSDSIKLLLNNGKLMALVTFLSLLLNVSFVLLFTHSLQSLVFGMFDAIQQSFMPPDPTSNSFNSTNPGLFAPQIGFDLVQIAHLLHQLRRDTAFLSAVEVSFILVLSIISFFSGISTIIISGLSYNAKISSLKVLFSKIRATWTRPLITSLYGSTLAYGYFFIVAMFSAPIYLYPDLPTLWLYVLIGIPSFLFYLYLLVPWNVSIVVAVVEESCYGLAALGRAASVVKGKRGHGFLLSMIYGLKVLGIFQFYSRKIRGDGITTMFLVLVTSISSLVDVFLFVAYTVFYFQCKMYHGEEVELHGSLEYTKLSTHVKANDVP